MNSKYYTPTIDEFHVEFEYERNIGSSTEHEKWKKIDDFSNAYEYEDDPLYGVIKDLRCENIRVKYLDKEDIKTCGFFKCNEHLGDYGPEELYLMTQNFNNVFLSNIVGTTCVEMYDNQGVIFKGNLKNKSELKKLIKQLGIDDN